VLPRRKLPTTRPDLGRRLRFQGKQGIMMIVTHVFLTHPTANILFYLALRRSRSYHSSHDRILRHYHQRSCPDRQWFDDQVGLGDDDAYRGGRKYGQQLRELRTEANRRRRSRRPRRPCCRCGSALREECR